MPPRRVAHKRANSAKDITTVASKKAKRNVSQSHSGAVKPKVSGKPDPEDSDEISNDSDSADDDEASDFEDVNDVEEEEEDDDEISEAASDDYSDKQSSAKRRISSGKGKGAQNTPPSHRKVTNRTVPKTKELLKPGVTTGLEPGTQVIMKKPKARAAGSTPYRDDTVHPNTMLFLGDLAANNNRQWLKSKFSLLFLPNNSLLNT
jgi:hypothetical protein